MTQFVKLHVARGPVSRVNIACILRYYADEQSAPASTIELAGGGVLNVAETVEQIDALLRDLAKDAGG